MADTYFYVHTVPIPSASTTSSAINNNLVDFVDILIMKTCELMNITVDQLYDGNKKTRSKFARWLIWEIMYSKGFTLMDCGRIFGGYDHTSVIHGLDHLPYDLKGNEFLSIIYDNILLKMEVNPEDITKMRKKRELNKVQRNARTSNIKV